MNISFKYIFFTTLLIISACEPEIKDKTVFEAGELNTNAYLAIGDAWTAGVSDNGLTRTGQNYAYPNLLAQQLALVGGGTFNQPLLPEGNGSGGYILTDIDSDICEGTSPLPELETKEADANWETNISSTGPFHNLGVQRMTLKDIDNKLWSTDTFQNLDSLNNNGPYLQRLLAIESIDTTSYLDLVKNTVTELSPTFFTSWFGFTDVLLYAASGGGFITGSPLGSFACDLDLGDISPSQLTETDVFEANYRKLLDEIITNSVDTPQGVLMTLPLVTRLPYFSAINTALKYRPETEIENDNYIDTLYLRRVPNCEDLIPVYGKSDGDTIQADINDFPLLTARFSFGNTPAFVCETGNAPHGFAYDAPLLDSEFLDKDEETKARARIAAFNNIIKNLGEEYNFLVVDMNDFLEKIQEGKVYNGIDVNANYLTGNFYSLDGLHFTPLGNAIITNEIIGRINTHFGASVPKLEVTDYPSISFP